MNRYLALYLAIVLSGFLAQQGQGAPDAQPATVGVPAETATHREVDLLPAEFQSISCLRLMPSGDILAGDSAAKILKRLGATGEVKQTIKLRGFGPEAVNFGPDGAVYCGGQGKLAMLNRSGEVLKTVDIPSNAESEIPSRRRASGRGLRISGIAVSDSDVFVAIGSGWSVGSKSKLFRFDLKLVSSAVLAEGLRGCCQRCDIEYRDGVLYLAENAAHRVVQMDRAGQSLAKWGRRDRMDPAGFGSCCNPMNIAFDEAGVLYTAESGLGRVKRYTADGQYLGLVGHVAVERFERAGGLAASCSNMAMAVTPNGDTVYIADVKVQRIRVLKRESL